MDSVRSKQLREKRGKLISDAQALVPTNGVAMTVELRTRITKMMSDADALLEDVKIAERLETMDAESRSTTTPPRAAPGSVAANSVDAEKHKAAFRSFLRDGDISPQFMRSAITGKEQRTTSAGMNIVTGAQGAFLIPQGFVYEIEEALKLFGGMREVASQFTTSSGNTLPWPTSNDTAVLGEQIAENTAVTGNTDPTIGHLNFVAWKYSTKLINVSLELIQDSAFDIDSYIKTEFVKRIGRITNQRFTVGVGTTEPMGIVTAVVAAPNTVTAEAIGAISYTDILKLEHQVDPAYRPGAKYMLHDLSLLKLKLLKDALGRPIFAPGIAVGAPDTINGYKYQINQDMPLTTTGQTSVVFGALDKYKIRNVQEMLVQRLTERFAEFGQVAYIGFARYDGNLLDAGTKPVAGLVHP